MIKIAGAGKCLTIKKVRLNAHSLKKQKQTGREKNSLFFSMLNVVFCIKHALSNNKMQQHHVIQILHLQLQEAKLPIINKIRYANSYWGFKLNFPPQCWRAAEVFEFPITQQEISQEHVMQHVSALYITRLHRDVLLLLVVLKIHCALVYSLALQLLTKTTTKKDKQCKK